MLAATTRRERRPPSLRDADGKPVCRGATTTALQHCQWLVDMARLVLADLLKSNDTYPKKDTH